MMVIDFVTRTCFMMERVRGGAGGMSCFVEISPAGSLMASLRRNEWFH